MNPAVCPPLWQIWRNPITRRYATARLRLLRVAAWSVLIQPLAAFLWLVVYLSAEKTVSAEHAALDAWIPILILQGLIWLLKGTFSVAVGIAREGAEGLSEVQRLTPLGAWHKVFGYLFGLPILETVLVASLLPWSVVSIGPGPRAAGGGLPGASALGHLSGPAPFHRLGGRHGHPPENRGGDRLPAPGDHPALHRAAALALRPGSLGTSRCGKSHHGGTAPIAGDRLSRSRG